MKSEKVILLFLFAALLFTACSESSVSADDSSDRGFVEKPRIETKPSEYAVYLYGTVSDSSGKPIPRARLYLVLEDKEEETYHDVIRDSTMSDSKGNFSFGYIAEYMSIYRILAKMPSKSGKSDSLLGYKDNVHFSWDGDSIYFDIVMDVPASLHLYSNFLNGWDDNPVDSVCFHGTLVCAYFSKEDQKRGYTIVTGLPVGDFGDFYAWHGDGISSVGCSIDPRAGDTLYVSDYAAGYPEDSLRIALPKSTSRMLDSLGLDKSLEKLFVPVVNSQKENCNTVVDELGEAVLCNYATNDSNSRYWLTFPELTKNSITAYWLTYGWGSTFTRNEDIKRFYASANPGDTVFADTLFQRHHNVYCSGNFILYKTQDEDDSKDSCTVSDWQEETLALSFWIDSSEKPDSSKAANRTIISAGRDTLGFKMAECEEDSKSICISINSNKDSVASGIYGKAKILDGKRHHVSFVVYKKHLCIIIDGVTIHDSDLEFSDEFLGSFAGIRVGKYPLSDVVVFQPGTYVHKEGDKDWGRLQAWFNAFYELQKKH